MMAGSLGLAPKRTRRSRVPLPRIDPRLGQLAVLLDSDAMAERLARTLAPATPLDGVRVRYVDLCPGGACTVGYHASIAGRRQIAVAHADVDGDAAARAGARASRAAAAALGGRCLAARPLSYDARIAALLAWYPLDLALPVLARPARELRRLAGAGGEPRLLSYRPGQRAVLRLGGVVLKAYGDDAGLRAGARGLLVAGRAGGPLAPVMLRRHGRLRFTVQTAIDGLEVPRERAVEVASRAGALLRSLHASPAAGLPTAAADHQLAAAGRSAALVAAVAPDLGRRAGTLLARLDRGMPPAGRAVASHGDFNVSQLLDVGGALALLDFDQACRAAPALDLAAYVANVVSGRPDDPEDAQAALAAILDGYGRRPDDLTWHLSAAVLRRAPSPFRRGKRDWPDRMAAIVATAEAVLAG